MKITINSSYIQALENLEHTYRCFIHNFNLFLQQSVLVDEVLNILKNDNNNKIRSVNALNGQDNHNKT